MDRDVRRRALLTLNLFLGLTAISGGVGLLAGWISVPVSSLAGSPFRDYTVPAMLLIVSVGGTAMLAACLVHLRRLLAAPLSAVAGGAIIIFEAVEWSVIGFAWLQAFYIGVGVVTLTVAAWAQSFDAIRSIRSMTRQE